MFVSRPVRCRLGQLANAQVPTEAICWFCPKPVSDRFRHPSYASVGMDVSPFTFPKPVDSRPLFWKHPSPKALISAGFLMERLANEEQPANARAPIEPICMSEKLIQERLAQSAKAESPMESRRSFSKNTDVRLVEPSHRPSGISATW